MAALRVQAAASSCPQAALFALTAISLAVSRMQRYSPDSGFPNMLLVGTYYVPPIGREIEVGSWYEGKIRALVKGYAAIRRGDAVSTPRASSPQPTPANSICPTIRSTTFSPIRRTPTQCSTAS